MLEIIDEQVIVPAEEKKFSQLDLDAAIESRLAREKARHEALLQSAKDDADNVRREARMRLAAAEGRIGETYEQRLAHEASQGERDANLLEQLSWTFGNRPGASLKAAAWMKEDPAGYREARHMYQALMGIQIRPAEPTVDSSKFTRRH